MFLQSDPNTLSFFFFSIGKDHVSIMIRASNNCHRCFVTLIYHIGTTLDNIESTVTTYRVVKVKRYKFISRVLKIISYPGRNWNIGLYIKIIRRVAL